MKRLLMILALAAGGLVSSLSLTDTADARPRYYGGYYAPRAAYRNYGYGPRYYNNYGYNRGYYNRGYYGPGYYGGGYGGGYYGGSGVYIGRGGVGLRW